MTSVQQAKNLDTLVTILCWQNVGFVSIFHLLEMRFSGAAQSARKERIKRPLSYSAFVYRSLLFASINRFCRLVFSAIKNPPYLRDKTKSAWNYSYSFFFFDLYLDCFRFPFCLT